jgi:hypothetical protein
MGAVLLVGGLVGSSIGALAFKLLRDAGQIDLTISLAYVVFLGLIGAFMAVESSRSLLRQRRGAGPQRKLRHRSWMHALPLKLRFRRSRLYISALLRARSDHHRRSDAPPIGRKGRLRVDRLRLRPSLPGGLRLDRRRAHRPGRPDHRHHPAQDMTLAGSRLRADPANDRLRGGRRMTQCGASIPSVNEAILSMKLTLPRFTSTLCHAVVRTGIAAQLLAEWEAG